MRTAARFQEVITPFRSLLMIASSDHSTIAARYWADRTAESACTKPDVIAVGPHAEVELGWKSQGQLQGRILRMHGATVASHDERRLLPRAAPAPLRQVFRANHGEQAYQWWVAFTKYDGSAAHDDTP